jgi:hypothetical protein
MITNNGSDDLENVVAKAHDICNRILLFEAVEMDEWEVRLVLESNDISDPALQDRYLRLVKEYDRNTGRT